MILVDPCLFFIFACPVGDLRQRGEAVLVFVNPQMAARVADFIQQPVAVPDKNGYPAGVLFPRPAAKDIIGTVRCCFTVIFSWMRL
ncbi:hypothetical protein PT300_09320 [Enterobacteriaceae bacterium ESL0689]|nr:hypothetical protein [Enterobacteriaceae bacterium ESL0689]